MIDLLTAKSELDAYKEGNSNYVRRRYLENPDGTTTALTQDDEPDRFVQYYLGESRLLQYERSPVTADYFTSAAEALKVYWAAETPSVLREVEFSTYARIDEEAVRVGYTISGNQLTAPSSTYCGIMISMTAIDAFTKNVWRTIVYQIDGTDWIEIVDLGEVFLPRHPWGWAFELYSSQAIRDVIENVTGT